MPITREIRDPRRLADRDLAQLSGAERLFLWRHRQPPPTGRSVDRFGRSGRAGGAMSQVEAAKLLGMSKGAYNKLENDLRTPLSVEDVRHLVGAISFAQPTPAELCLIARRRSGLRLSQIEREAQVSRQWFLELEKLGNPRVIDFWTARGFSFPTAAVAA